jgi:6-phosphogluconolactonase
LKIFVRHCHDAETSQRVEKPSLRYFLENIEKIYLNSMTYIATVLFLTILLIHPAVSINNKRATSSPVCYVYLSLDSSRCIAVYQMNNNDGKLHFIKRVETDGEPGSLTADPVHHYLYTSIRSTNSISTFRIDSATGDLSFVSSMGVAGNPVYLSTDQTGRFLLTAYFADSKAAVYEIDRNGAPKDSAVQVIPTEKNAHAIQTDPSNRYVLIPCRTGETILQFKFDHENGKLSPNIPDRIHTDSLTGPRHFVFHSKLNTVYFCNEFASSVTAYRFNPSHGTLSAFQSLSMLPKNFSGQNKAADIHLTPDNRFLYASNRGHESIAAYSIDSISGTMTFLGNFATEKSPRSFDIDPDGKFLYAGGQGSGNLAAYRIDHLNGTLTLFDTYYVGNHPAWVMIVRMQ